MISWPSPALPSLPADTTAVPLRLHDTVTGRTEAVEAGPDAFRLYVCGITPYDATHLGHAATYVTFDLVQRAMIDNGHRIRYVQNVTDVDDPLLERAARDAVAWDRLAEREMDLFREDMTALGVLAPTELAGVVESVDEIADGVRSLLASGHAYAAPTPDVEGEDIYFDCSGMADPSPLFGWSRAEMLDGSHHRGGDPDRAGKRDPLDPLLWRVARRGEPSWPAPGLGAGRPGWHVECSVICTHHLAGPADLKGGGVDLVFPHHEMSAAHARALTGRDVFARRWAHVELVSYEGAKMSKSKGNLVKVSELRNTGVEPMAIRLVLLAQHYRTAWEYTPDLLEQAQRRLRHWTRALSGNGGPPWRDALAQLRERLADDLDSAGALRVMDDWAAAAASDESVIGAPGVMARAVDALLGVRL